MAKFTKLMHAGWSDVDFNMHMRNTAYLDKSVEARMQFFSESGFSVQTFLKLGVGPVIKHESIAYFREIRMLEQFQVTLEAEGSSEDGSRFRLRNDIVKLDGTLAARVSSTGGWLDIAARKLIAPPAEIFAVMQKVERVENFEVLPSSRKAS